MLKTFINLAKISLFIVLILFGLNLGTQTIQAATCSGSATASRFTYTCQYTPINGDLFASCLQHTSDLNYSCSFTGNSCGYCAENSQNCIVQNNQCNITEDVNDNCVVAGTIIGNGTYKTIGCTVTNGTPPPTPVGQTPGPTPGPTCQCSQAGAQQCTGGAGYQTCDGCNWVAHSCSPYTCKPNGANNITCGCTSGASCTSGQKGLNRCSGGGGGYQSCDGTCWNDATCPNPYICVVNGNTANCGCASGASCTQAGAQRCAANGFQQCDGSCWSNVNACPPVNGQPTCCQVQAGSNPPNASCLAAACGGNPTPTPVSCPAGACTVGTYQCVSNQPQKCNPDPNHAGCGVWANNGAACGTGTSCSVSNGTCIGGTPSPTPPPVPTPTPTPSGCLTSCPVQNGCGLWSGYPSGCPDINCGSCSNNVTCTNGTCGGSGSCTSTGDSLFFSGITTSPDGVFAYNTLPAGITGGSSGGTSGFVVVPQNGKTNFTAILGSASCATNTSISQLTTTNLNPYICLNTQNAKSTSCDQYRTQLQYSKCVNEMYTDCQNFFGTSNFTQVANSTSCRDLIAFDDTGKYYSQTCPGYYSPGGDPVLDNDYGSSNPGPIIQPCNSQYNCEIDGNGAAQGYYEKSVKASYLTGSNTVSTQVGYVDVYVIKNPKIPTSSCKKDANVNSTTDVTLTFPTMRTYFQGAYHNDDNYKAFFGTSSLGTFTPTVSGGNSTIVIPLLNNGHYDLQIYGYYSGVGINQGNPYARDLAVTSFDITAPGVCSQPTYTVKGNFFLDNNYDGVWDQSNESAYQGYTNATFTVKDSNGNTVSPTITQDYSGGNGYTISGLAAGSYTIHADPPPSYGYVINYPNQGNFTIQVGKANVQDPTATCDVGGSNSATCDANGNINDLDFALTSPLSITGEVFIDTNGNGVKDPGESTYSGPITISDSLGNIAQTSGGTYDFEGETPGTYQITYNNLPGGYTLTYPTGNVGSPSITVTIGANSCNKFSDPNAICNNPTYGSIANLDFGIQTGGNGWICVGCGGGSGSGGGGGGNGGNGGGGTGGGGTNGGGGGDVRIDSGVDNPIPANVPAQCGGGFMNIAGSGGTPGVIYSGSNNANFGNGQASSTGWVVQAPDGQNYRPPTPNTIRTAYNYLLSNANQQGLTEATLDSQCSGGLANCTLSGSIPSGFYLANGDLTLNSNYTFPANKNYIILVHGNLNLNGQIHVPLTSSVIFSASGNITVSPGVGESTNTSSTADLEGIYSADQNFIVNGSNDCAVAPDNRLNIAGNVIVNAALGGGTFQNNRNLCAGNICPAISISPRLDMILNLPAIVKAPNYIWQEVAP